MNMGMDNVIYWFKNQAAIVYVADEISSSNLAARVTSFRTTLNEQVLKLKGFKLIPFKTGNTHQQADASTGDEVDDTTGVYSFNPAKATNAAHEPNPSTVVVFYNIVPAQDGMTGSMAGMGSMGGSGGNGGNSGMSMSDTADYTLAVVDELNTHKEELKSLHVRTFAALPRWLAAGTPDGTHGCPISPPVPVQQHPGSRQWKTTFRLANPAQQDKTGAGVTVFVLDTLPDTEQIKNAAKNAGSSNLLLQDIVQQYELGRIKFDDQVVPGPQDSAITGKDIYGRLAGFPLDDHGLFITGIIHELAPQATIECIRVLNQYGVGTLDTLTAALQKINNRMSEGSDGPQGDLFGKPVVINLSLVMGPPENELQRLGLDSDSADPYAKVKPYVEGIKPVLYNLVEAGAVFAASASNDSDPRDISMNPNEVRYGPRFPAAFLYDDPPVRSMLPVGAVNGYENAASYSNHPGPEGFGAYGGEVPKPEPWMPSAMSHVITGVDNSEAMDAFRGIYSSQLFPALSMNDQYPEADQSRKPYPMYPMPDSGAWAYWSGTSFATPVITALVARILQGYQGRTPEERAAYVRQELIAASDKIEKLWTGVEDQKIGHQDLDGYAVMVRQTH